MATEHVLERGREEASRARYADGDAALRESAFTWKMVSLVLAALSGVLGFSLALAAVRPAPAFITHLGRDGLYVPGAVTAEDVEVFALEFVDLIATMRPDDQAIDGRIKQASRLVHPAYAEPWLAAAEAFRFEVLSAQKTTVFDAMDSFVERAGEGWQVHVYGMRKRYVGDRRVDEGGFCYAVLVERVDPTTTYPRPITVKQLAEPRECSDREYHAIKERYEAKGQST